MIELEPAWQNGVAYSRLGLRNDTRGVEGETMRRSNFDVAVLFGAGEETVHSLIFSKEPGSVVRSHQERRC